MKLTSRKEAKAAGLTRYFTGVACPKGHICERFCSNRKCIRCLRTSDNAKRRNVQNGKKWRDKNPELYKKQNALYYQKNSVLFKARAKAWSKANPEYSRVQTLKRIARKKNATGDYSIYDIRGLFTSQKGKCAAPHCKKDIINNYHIDHIQPLSRGGSNWPSNLQLLCPPCNGSKWNRTMQEWACALALAA